jgi:hypothetical protein
MSTWGYFDAQNKYRTGYILYSVQYLVLYLSNQSCHYHFGCVTEKESLECFWNLNSAVLGLPYTDSHTIVTEHMITREYGFPI